MKMKNFHQKEESEKNIEIKNKMNLNKTNQMNITPIHLAYFNEKILQEILDYGEELNFQDKKGRKPIFYAVVYKSSGPLILLLENKCSLNDRDNQGYTPLILACKRGRYKNVKLLLEKGADPI
jgi:ankyrin repeat protein